jgi:hypothetical protein
LKAVSSMRKLPVRRRDRVTPAGPAQYYSFSNTAQVIRYSAASQ